MRNLVESVVHRNLVLSLGARKRGGRGSDSQQSPGRGKMKRRKSLLAAFSRKRGAETGVTTLEYAIMLVLVSLAVSTFGMGLGGSVDSVFSRMVLSLSDDDSEREADDRERDLSSHQ